MVSCQSNVSCIFLILSQLVDLVDYCVCLRPAVAVVDVVPLRFAAKGYRRACPSACALMDRWDPVDTSIRVGKVGDFGCGAVSPSVHHFVVQIGPHLRSVLYGVLSSEAQRAFRPAAPGCFLLNIEEDEMRMRVPDVVPGLVMDCGDISGDTLAQAFSKSMCQRLSLCRGSFYGKSDHKSLADPPLAPLGLFFGACGGLEMSGT